jgi:hypothetical protein
VAWGRCDLVNQGAWDREPLLAGILGGYVRDELGFVADNDVKVEVRIRRACTVCRLGLWRTRIRRVLLPWNLLCGTFVLLG